MEYCSTFFKKVVLLTIFLVNFSVWAVETPEYYQRLSEQSHPPESYNFLLKAADLEFSAGHEEAGYALLHQIPTDPNNSIVEAYKQILLTELALKKKNVQGAFTTLESLSSVQQLPFSLAIRYYTAKAIAHRGVGQLLESVQARVLLDPLLKEEPENTAQNRRIIWETLMQVPLRTLKLAKIAPPPDILGGWLSLAYITKEYAAKTNQLSKALAEWHATYPLHPANMIAPTPLEEHIALFLPFSGPYQSAGEAIREGFLTAHYGNTLPKKPSIRLYDTTQYTSLSELYRQAIAAGASLVVGPLTKEEVKQMAHWSNRDLMVPTIALNTPDTTRKLPDHLFTFALQPETEGISIADQLSTTGYHHAVLFSSTTSSNKRAAIAFNQQFVALNGTVLNQDYLLPQANLGKTVSHLLQIDDSQTRAQLLKKIVGRKIDFQPRRRQDIDAIVLMSSPEQARQLRPLFDFYYAQDLPIYALSNVYEGMPNPTKDQDMNRIVFCDMPWILDDQHPLHAHKMALEALIGDKMETEARLFAFGLDAYQLTTRINQLSNSPSAHFLGATGHLFIRDHHTVERQLAWARMQNGAPKLLKDQHNAHF